MNHAWKAMLASALTVVLVVGLMLTLKTTQAEGKTHIIYCGSPGEKTCNPYPYRTLGGRESHCAKHSPCYLNSDCTGDQVCDTQQPSNTK
jgi:hypothetical protein